MPKCVASNDTHASNPHLLNPDFAPGGGVHVTMIGALVFQYAGDNVLWNKNYAPVESSGPYSAEFQANTFKTTQAQLPKMSRLGLPLSLSERQSQEEAEVDIRFVVFKKVIHELA